MKRIPAFKLLTRFAIAATVATAAASAMAQLPPIRILVGFPAGGSSDVVARHLALAMQTELNRSVIVENRPGAGGQIAAQALKTAKPDGTTIFMSNSHTVSMIPLTMINPGYDPVKDFVPIGMVAISPDVFAINVAAVGSAAGLKEYGAWAKANPGKGNVGVPAPASAPEFAVGLVAKGLDTDLKAVPYRGDGPVALDLVGGQISGGIGSIGAMLPHVAGGKIKIVAVNGTQRLPLIPNVPTYAEQGVKGYEEVIFTAMFGPAGMPPALVQTYNAVISKVVKSPEFASKLTELGIIPVASTPNELAARVAATNKDWTQMVKNAGYKPQ